MQPIEMQIKEEITEIINRNKYNLSPEQWIDIIESMKENLDIKTDVEFLEEIDRLEGEIEDLEGEISMLEDDIKDYENTLLKIKELIS